MLLERPVRFVGLVLFVAGLLAACQSTPQSATPAPGADLVQARQALQAYFDLLHDGRYAEAASYYGGNYEMLWEWNPTVAHDDHATLLENGCEVNGLQCLAIKDIVGEKELSSGEYLFTVEFLAADGGTFVSEPSIKQFSCTVIKIDEQFLVQELPIYVP